MKQFNVNNLVRENIRALKPYSSARDEYKEMSSNMVFLDANENLHSDHLLNLSIINKT